jgi:hypothetical protein
MKESFHLLTVSWLSEEESKIEGPTTSGKDLHAISSHNGRQKGKKARGGKHTCITQ